jgi:nucleoside-diphosphate-sugar epimerase
VAGDITRPGLGLSEAIEPAEIFHFAAIYELNMSRSSGMLVNVEGTRNVLRYAEQCSGLQFLHYVSTCYVSGRYAGPFRETDLDKGQNFNNYYEETKFLAELEVQRSQVPWIVYRPSIVVGDSRTGATLKYDGPYPVIRWLLRQPGLALMPIVGDPSTTRLNLVPQDYVLDAMTYLSTHRREARRVYCLADPNPMTVEDTVNELGKDCRRVLLRLPLPLNLAKWALKHIPGIASFSGFTPAIVDYFVHPTHYLTDATEAALAGSGIRCPDMRLVLPQLVDYVRKNPKAPTGG